MRRYAARADCSEHTLKFLRILVDVQQRCAALKLRLVKRDHVPQSALRACVDCSSFAVSDGKTKLLSVPT